MSVLNQMTLQEKIEFLRRNPIFWSRLGYEMEKPEVEVHLRHAERHKAMYDKGILVHSCIVPVGWVGPDQYDYTLTDRYLEMLFSHAPDVLYLPRVKLNIPEGWCEAHPEDIFVYAEGPRGLEEIKAMIGTEAHGSHPPKPTDLLAQQSFSSKQWIDDASEALRRFIEHVESSPWADRIIGYHLAYGTAGETTQWGTWDSNPRHKGDYGIAATKAFLDYAEKRGKHYDDLPAIDERFYIEKDGIPHRYHVGTPTLDTLFFHTEKDERCILHSEFTRDSNMDALEAFCRVAKEMVPEKVVGVFHGYITEPENCANMQHTGFDRMLASPYIDFVAGPKGYNRVGPTHPGFGQAVPNSANRKKLWVDEIDNRTHLCTWRGPKDFPAVNFDQTRAVYWREFTKNAVHLQGYWWMDLGGGWLDSEEIRDEIALLNKTSQDLYQEAETHQKVAEILLVINENAMHRMRPNFELHRATIHHTGSIFKESGVPIDFYRTADLAELDLSRYKMIVFLNAFCEDAEKLQALLKGTRSDCHIVWNYAAGIIDQKSGSFGVENIRKLTGFSVDEYPYGGIKEYAEPCYPVLYVKAEEGVVSHAAYSDGRIRTASRKSPDGRTHILNAHPIAMTVEGARDLMKKAGVHLYAPAYCVVNTDNRFIYLLSEKEQSVTVRFKEPTTCRNIFTDEQFEKVDSVTYDMKEGTCIFLKYQK